MPFDSFSFLDRWSLVLPDRFPCVLAVAGRGAKSTLLHRLATEYAQQGRKVLATRSACGPALSAPQIDTALADEAAGSDLRALARARGADVVLVEAQKSCGSLLWPDGPPPIWPQDVDLAFSCVNLASLGRLWSAEVVHEAPDRGDSQRRVNVDDLIEELKRQGATDGRIDGGAAWIPFLSGLGSLRSMDAMFSLGGRLVDELGARIVCFGELLTDPRRDESDRRSIEGSSAAAEFLTGDRIYAIHPRRGRRDDLPTA